MVMGKQSAWTVVTLGILLFYLHKFFDSRLPVHMDGFVASGFTKVAKTFRSNLEGGLEKGGAFSVYYKGSLIVDIWGGHADHEADVHWSRETMTHFLTVSKVATTISVALLVDRGLLRYDTPIAQYWPEFAQNGKSKITLRTLLSHQAGIPYIDNAVVNETTLRNPEELADIIARQTPVWKPGTGHGYHAYTTDMVVDHVIKRVDPVGRNIARFFADEVASKLGVEFSIGLHRNESYRLARLHPISPSRSLMQSVFSLHLWKLFLSSLFFSNSYLIKSTTNPGFYDYRNFNHYKIRELELPFIGGVGTARALAKTFGILANSGEFAGVPLMSEKLLNEFDEVVAHGYDKTLLTETTYGLGFMVKKNPTGHNMFGHAGVGGAAVFADPHHQIGFAYVTNYPSVYDHGTDPRLQALVDASYECLQRFNKKRT